jgi:hypothetical protein
MMLGVREDGGYGITSRPERDLLNGFLYTYIFISEQGGGEPRECASLQLIRDDYTKRKYNACATQHLTLFVQSVRFSALIKCANTVVPGALVLVIFCAPAIVMMYIYTY